MCPRSAAGEPRVGGQGAGEWAVLFEDAVCFSLASAGLTHTFIYNNSNCGQLVRSSYPAMSSNLTAFCWAME